MVVILSWQVISRYVLNDPSTLRRTVAFSDCLVVLLGAASILLGCFSHGMTYCAIFRAVGSGNSLSCSSCQFYYFQYLLCLILGGLHSIQIASKTTHCPGVTMPNVELLCRIARLWCVVILYAIFKFDDV